LNSIPTDEGRSEIENLGRRVNDAVRAGRDKAGADEQQLLDELAERIRWHFRAARYAMPSTQELRHMIADHFS
jgi:hypothetical protein